MPLLLSAIPWKLLAVGLFAVAVFGTFVGCQQQSKKIGRLEAQLDSAIEVSNQNALIAEKHFNDLKRIQEVQAEGAKAKGKIRDATEQRKAKINESPQSDDAPLAPVLRRTLDGLRNPTDAERDHSGALPSTGA